MGTRRSYQEDLRRWVEGPVGADQKIKKSEEDRRKWTKMQVEQVSQGEECTLPELEILCKKRGILIWSVKYYSPDFFRAVIEKSRRCAMQDIIEEMGTEWCSPHRLRTLVREKNGEYNLGRHHGEISCDDIQEYDPDWFNTVFEQRYVSLSDIIERDGHPPRFRKVLDGEYTQ